MWAVGGGVFLCVKVLCRWCVCRCMCVCGGGEVVGKGPIVNNLCLSCWCWRVGSSNVLYWSCVVALVVVGFVTISCVVIMAVFSFVLLIVLYQNFI